jgi:hypothetical protein
MNKTAKTILIILGTLLFVCACSAAILMGTGLWGFNQFVEFADNSTTENPQEVAQIASEIADFDVPETFTKQYGMKIATFSMVQYMNSSEDTFLFITQFPAGTSINPDEMMREIQNNSRNPNSTWYNNDTHIVEEKPVTIRGEETTLSISEGTSEQGVLYRLANAKFQGNGEGPAVFMIVGPADEWDSQLVEDLLASIQ